MLENSCLLRPFARNAYKLLGRLPYYDIMISLKVFKMCCGKTPSRVRFAPRSTVFLFVSEEWRYRPARVAEFLQFIAFGVGKTCAW